MKKILFLLAFVIFLACNKKTITEEPLCQNPPPSFELIVVNKEVPNNKYFNDFETAKKEAVLYKLSGNEKVKIQNLYVNKENIFISSQFEEVKTFFTGNLETFYVEYKGETDTLQVKGNYYENTKCGDTSVLLELYFNSEKIDSIAANIGAIIYKTDNTPISDK